MNQKKAMKKLSTVKISLKEECRTATTIKSTMGSKVKESSDIKQEKITREEALNLYTNTLNFNVISRYDPAIKQLLCNTSHCVLYNFNDETEEWVKSDFQGTLALYIREFKVPKSNSEPPTYQDLQDLFATGLCF